MYAKVRELILEIVDVPEDLVTREADLGETLHMDSVHLVEVATRLESIYGIMIEDRHLYDLVTVQDMVDLTTSRRQVG